MAKIRGGKGEEGNIMLLILVTLLALAVLGTAVLNVAGMEQKLALYDTKVKKAQSAADSGLEIVRDFFIKELKNTSELNQDRVNAIKNEAQAKLVKASPFSLPDGSQIFIKEVDTSRLLNYGEVKVVAAGKNGKASRRVTATLSFNTLPVKALHADRLKVVGTYYLESDNVPVNVDGYYAGRNVYESPQKWPYIEETAYTIKPDDGNSHISKEAFWWTNASEELVILGVRTGLYKIHYAPYYRAQGRLLADNPEEIWFNCWDDQPGNYRGNLFYPGSDLSKIADSLDPLKWGCVRHEPPRNPDLFKSRHFTGSGIASLSERGIYRKPPEFTEKHLEKIREVARKEANEPGGKWAYINNGNTTLYLFALKRPYTFVELNPGSTLNISFGVPPGQNIVSAIANFFFTVISLFTEGVPGVMLVTPADVRISFNNDLFNIINEVEQILGTIFTRVKEAQYLFITPGNITLQYDAPLTVEDWNIYALAGKNIDVLCEAKPLNSFWSYNHGSLNAGGNLNIVLKHDKDIIWGNQVSTADRVFKVRKDTRPVESFRERWSLIGIGRIVSYKAENGE